MKTGDLVRLRSEVFSFYPLGLVIKVLSESVVVVAWVGEDAEYLETVSNLEVISV